ncbi:hypothetical protein [Marinobacter sp. 2_MG-2023]|uniref:hypothetical protein n=1 Tax=Marinobacter sp. 2_MG-2023 TaxID=3062679 RepID=UPI0026E1EC5A|nr:hypothetical protein [Marinobacter sp. 2_MG-2023]MDO6443606.1 hypothetical protein [Marinobacter sp. 2_MG-2023]
MISETTFAKKFTSFWVQLLPNANNYIRLVNGAMVKSLYTPERPVRGENVALCNTIAFEIFRLEQKGAVDVSDIKSGVFFSNKLFFELAQQCVDSLRVFSHGSAMKLPLSKAELDDVKSIAVHMVEYFPPRSRYLVFDPGFDGLGFLNGAEGDILFRDALVEVKAGYRNFSVNDIRQLLVYLTLNHYSQSPHEINRVELYNPRMGSVFEANVHQLCDDISALQPSDLYHEILLFVTENNFVELPET